MPQDLENDSEKIEFRRVWIYGKKRWIPGRRSDAGEYGESDEAGAEDAASDGRAGEGNGDKGIQRDITKFVASVKKSLTANDIKGAQELCKKQQGTVAAVVAAALKSYEEMDKNTELTKEQKILNLQKAVEEATALEMPSLQQNLPIVATMTTLGTLVGLLGTVMGMIKSFQALAQSGAPDSTELSTGISEALVNTAFGIATGAFAVISYNFYTNKIDNLTYAIDEIGFSIVQTFQATH